MSRSLLVETTPRSCVISSSAMPLCRRSKSAADCAHARRAPWSVHRLSVIVVQQSAQTRSTPLSHAAHNCADRRGTDVPHPAGRLAAASRARWPPCSVGQPVIHKIRRS
jgi:hypothetical protein